jgi:hypothetical protein
MFKKEYIIIVLLSISGIGYANPSLAVGSKEGSKVLTNNHCKSSDITKLLKNWTRDNVLSLLGCISSPVLKYTVVPGGGYGDLRDYGIHAAVDYAAPIGTKVLAMFNGTVTKIFNSPLCGDGIEIKGGIYTQLACHVQSIVKVGQSVLAGQPIGKINMSGRTTGSHAHVQLRVNDKPVDPEKFLRDPEQVKKLIASLETKNNEQEITQDTEDTDKISTEREAWITLNASKEAYSLSYPFSSNSFNGGSNLDEYLKYSIQARENQEQLEDATERFFAEEIGATKRLNKLSEQLANDSGKTRKSLSSSVPGITLSIR